MKLPSLFKIQEKSSFSPLPCPFRTCGNLKTLSFRVENNHNIFNSKRFYNNVNDVESVIEGLKSEKERFFFQAGEKTSSILDVSSSKNNGSSNTFEFLPFNESCVTTMDSMDPLEDFKKPLEEMVEANQEIDTSSILEVPSSPKSNNDSSNGLELLSFNDSCVVAMMDSMDPYEDFKKSMEEMVEANKETKDCEKCLEEMLIWYLKVNGEHNHRYIIDAFFDVLNNYTSTNNTTSYSHSFTNSPFSFCSNSSFSASTPPFLSLLEAEEEITATRRYSV